MFRCTVFVGRSFIQPTSRSLNFARTFKTAKNVKTLTQNNTNITRLTALKRSFKTVATNVAETKPKYSLNLLIGGAAAISLGGIAVYNFVNAPTNTPSYITQRVRATYCYLAGGLAVTAVSATAFFRSGLANRMLVMNPWLLFGMSFVGIIGASTVTRMIPYENFAAKHLAFGGFCAIVAASLCPIVAVGGTIILQAAAATATIVGSLSIVSAIAPEGTFSSLSGPLTIGLGAVIAASLGTLAFPASGLLYTIAIYGGTAVFSLFVLFDTQRMLENSKYLQHYDPINNCIGIYMSTINIFINMVNILISGKRK